MPTLSEAESKALLAAHGVPVAAERLVATAADAAAAATELGLPVAVKLCGTHVAHKTERGLVRLGVATAADVEHAATELLAAGRPADGVTGVLVAPMVRGNRELIAGVATDAQFGPTVMLGLGGVLAEAIADVVFRLLPLDEQDAYEMIDDLATQQVLGAFRGEPAIDRDEVVNVLLGLSALLEARPDLVSIDVNPLVVDGGKPVAVDALVEVA